MSDQFVLYLHNEHWCVAVKRADGRGVDIEPVSFNGAADTSARAGAVKDTLDAMSYEGQPIMLALPSSWCLSAVISTDDLERTGRRRALGYRLEEHLPLSAEESVADYIETRKGEAIGVCAELERLKPIVEGLEGLDIPIRHIYPIAILAAAYGVSEQRDVSGVLLTSAADMDAAKDSVGELDLVELRQGRPAAWWWFADDLGAAEQRLAAWAESEQPGHRLTLFGRLDAVSDSVNRIMTPGQVVDSDTSVLEAATRHAAKLLEGADSPWVELRRDALAGPDQYQAYGKPIAACVLAAVLLLVSVIAATQWRGRQYRSLADGFVQQQQAVFRKAMPDQRMPANIRARLVSEGRKLAGLGGQASAGGTTPIGAASALERLRDTLAALPKGLRFRILDLNIQSDMIRIDGQARSHADAERIAIALRQTGRYEVEAPNTESIKSGGVSFWFTAKPQPEPALAKGGRP